MAEITYTGPLGAVRVTLPSGTRRTFLRGVAVDVEKADADALVGDEFTAPKAEPKADEAPKKSPADKAQPKEKP